MSKKRFALLVSSLLLLSANSKGQSDIAGFWKGGVSRDGAIQIVEIEFTAHGDSIKGTYNLPGMGLYEELIRDLTYSDTTLSFKFFMGSFQCIFHKQYREITGDNKDWKPIGLKLHLKKEIRPAQMYETSFVDIAIMGDVLPGTLYRPLKPGKHPTIILAHGAQDPSRKNWIYRYFAYMLPQYGYNVFIFDQRRGTKDKSPSLFEHADDMINIAKTLSKRKDVDKARIGIIGMSRGGWVASIAASKTPLFKTVILLAGPAKGPIELEFDVVRASLISEGFSQKQIDSALHFTSDYFKSVRDTSLWSQLMTEYEIIKSRPWASVLQKPVSPLDANVQWWKRNDHDAAIYLRSIRSSVLSVFGTSDVLVPPSSNTTLMKQHLSATKQPFAVITIDDLPHGLYHYQTLHKGAFSWPSQYWVWPKRSFVLDSAVLDWLGKELLE
jgi:pimeloyl-ACP methyl ester carboxylesterase